MKNKIARLSLFLVAVFVLVSSMTGCAWLLPAIEEYEPDESALELVGEPTLDFTYNEETGYYDVYVEGVARNAGELLLNNCYVYFAVYDGEGNLICVAEDYIYLIDTELSWRFAAVGMTRYEPATVELLELYGYDW